jgi:hypothetical protein
MLVLRPMSVEKLEKLEMYPDVPRPATVDANRGALPATVE